MYYIQSSILLDVISGVQVAVRTMEMQEWETIVLSLQVQHVVPPRARSDTGPLFLANIASSSFVGFLFTS
jgi:hypothetical protein